jgi:hypothetical protein
MSSLARPMGHWTTRQMRWQHQKRRAKPFDLVEFSKTSTLFAPPIGPLRRLHRPPSMRLHAFRLVVLAET